MRSFIPAFRQALLPITLIALSSLCNALPAQIFKGLRLATSDAGYIPASTFDIDGNGYKDFMVFKNSTPAVFLVDSAGLAYTSTYLADLTDLPSSAISSSRKTLVTDIDSDGKNDLLMQISTVGVVRTSSFNTTTSKYCLPA